MAGTFNKAILVGRLTKDIELRRTTSGTEVAQFSVAVDRNVGKGKQSQADFINCVAWKERAEFLSNYGRKGTLLLIEGKIQTDNYTDQKTNRTVYRTYILVDNVQLLGSKPSQNAEAPRPLVPDAPQYSQNQYNQQAQQVTQQYQQQPQQPADPYGYSSIPSVNNEGLPF